MHCREPDEAQAVLFNPTLQSMTTESTSSYDDVPYQSNPFAQSQPERLAVVAKLFGLQPVLPSNAKVLELGCASGGNLIPLAARYPHARFHGIDFSARQVSVAQKHIAALALDNIRIETGDITTFAPRETFDYIICHGVYSWVPEATRAAILRICREALTEQGVAYISYNTYPGWRLREVVREAMLFHAGDHVDTTQRLTQGRAFLQFMQQASDPASIFGQMLKIESDMIANFRDDYVLHEHLEQHNHPCYFKDFMAQADAHRLGYLGEANFIEMLPQHFAPDVQRTLEQASGGNIILTEQYMDFLRNRYFRQTLLVRAEQVSDIQRNLRAERLNTFQLSANIKTQHDVDVTSSTIATFESAPGRSMNVTEPIIKAALIILGQHFPKTIDFDALFRAARARSNSVELQRITLLDALQALALNGILELQVEPLDFVGASRSHPQAFAPAREQARSGASATNQRHEQVTLNPFQVALLALLNGELGIAEIEKALIDECVAGKIGLEREGVAIRDREGIAGWMPGLVQENLRLLELAALLI